MDKKTINLNKVENFLVKAKTKLQEGIEDIGEKNMNKLDDFLSEIRFEKDKKSNLNNIKNVKEINFEADDLFDYEKFIQAKGPIEINNSNKANKNQEINKIVDEKSNFIKFIVFIF